MNSVTPKRRDVTGESLVIFDVAFSDKGVLEVVLELGKDVFQRFVEDVGQDVEPSAMGHPQNQVLDLALIGRGDNIVQDWNQRFGTFQRKALLPQEFAMEKRFEQGGFLQLLQNQPFVLLRKFGAVARPLHAVLEPLALLGVLDVHEFHPDGAAVGLAHHSDNLPQGGVLLDESTGMEHRVEIGFRQAENTQIEQRVIEGAGFEGVGTGEQVPDIAISVDQRLNAGLLQGKFGIDTGLGAGRRFVAQVKPFKKTMPVGTDTGGIPQPALVQSIDPRRVKLGGKRHIRTHPGQK